MILRDVDVIHHGSPNDSDRTRVLPCIRFLLGMGLRQGYQPRSFLQYSKSLRQEIGERLFQKLVFMFTDEMEDDDDDMGHTTRYRTPASMRIENIQ